MTTTPHRPSSTADVASVDQHIADAERLAALAEHSPTAEAQVLAGLAAVHAQLAQITTGRDLAAQFTALQSSADEPAPTYELTAPPDPFGAHITRSLSDVATALASALRERNEAIAQANTLREQLTVEQAAHDATGEQLVQFADRARHAEAERDEARHELREVRTQLSLAAADVRESFGNATKPAISATQPGDDLDPRNRSPQPMTTTPDRPSSTAPPAIVTSPQ